MNELALFAGVGGGILGGLLCGFRTVCAVEIEPYCREVLLRRQRDGVLPMFPIWDDVRTFDGRPWRGLVDVITAGFPCQPFSVAGKGEAEDDSRNMWPDTIRIIGEVQPVACLLENVPGLLAHEYSRTIFGELAAAGFDAEWASISAEELGAPIVRERLFIVAVSNEVYGTERLGNLADGATTIQRGTMRERNELWLQAPPPKRWSGRWVFQLLGAGWLHWKCPSSNRGCKRMGDADMRTERGDSPAAQKCDARQKMLGLS